MEIQIHWNREDLSLEPLDWALNTGILPYLWDWKGICLWPLIFTEQILISACTLLALAYIVVKKWQNNLCYTCWRHSRSKRPVHPSICFNVFIHAFNLLYCKREVLPDVSTLPFTKLKKNPQNRHLTFFSRKQSQHVPLCSKLANTPLYWNAFYSYGLFISTCFWKGGMFPVFSKSAIWCCCLTQTYSCFPSLAFYTAGVSFCGD